MTGSLKEQLGGTRKTTCGPGAKTCTPNEDDALESIGVDAMNATGASRASFGEFCIKLKLETLMGQRIAQMVSMCAALLVGTSSYATDTKAQLGEKAVAISSTDASLKWGECPAFLPKGCGIAVLHGDPAKHNADVFFKVPAKSDIALHWHSSAERMILVKGALHLTYEGQKEVVLKEGDYAFGPGKLPHKGHCASSNPCILFIAFETPVDAVPIEESMK